jgi:hypothetical protein
MRQEHLSWHRADTSTFSLRTLSLERVKRVGGEVSLLFPDELRAMRSSHDFTFCPSAISYELVWLNDPTDSTTVFTEMENRYLRRPQEPEREMACPDTPAYIHSLLAFFKPALFVSGILIVSKYFP